MPVVAYDVILILRAVKDEIEKTALVYGLASVVVGAKTLNA